MRKKHIHERRKITFQEYAALLATRAMLVNATLAWTNSPRPVPGCHLFNMHTKGGATHCGTVGCIGGTMAMVMGKDPSDYVFDHVGEDLGWRLRADTCSKSLSNLFYPVGDEWDWIKPKVAVKAIDNWLRTGKPGWKKLQLKARG